MVAWPAWWTGALWENYVIAERMKYHLYAGRHTPSYFWRTYDQQEIDLVEDYRGQLAAAEMKWSPKSAPRVPGGWQKAYPNSAFQVVHQENYLGFVTDAAQ